ncbi:abortive infection family protein [Alienimonas sp. DA493]|uniref:abortive infection family protein n=1 Tax=Alienimonas sp. DA493 TaxID=3373605 RepID=UPI003753F4A0
MATLTFRDRRLMEDVFGMKSGYVLDFSNRTFQDFIGSEVRRDIEADHYGGVQLSKANRLRNFWELEDDQIVGRLTIALAEYASELPEAIPHQVEGVRKIGERLVANAGPVDLAAISPLDDDAVFEALADEVRLKIREGQPERGLDRLHTYAVRFFRHQHEKRGHSPSRDTPLHGLAGQYAKMLQRSGMIRSPMTERIIRSNIGLLDAFCAVRNEQSLAHDNELLNRSESLLIVNQVCSLIRFLRSLEGTES